MAKRVVVTGASSGIGTATARLFRERGWDVVGVARRGERLAALATETGIHPIVADVTDQADVDRVRDEVAALGPVHALINNAGGALGSATVEHGDPADWQAMFDVNVLGTKRMITAMLPLLRDAARQTVDGRPGHADILSITSVA
ncbi:MAG: SDR family NAD(P)-dependent oxidoreductase, partial [Leifsonia sp.]